MKKRVPACNVGIWSLQSAFGRRANWGTVVHGSGFIPEYFGLMEADLYINCVIEVELFLNTFFMEVDSDFRVGVRV